MVIVQSLRMVQGWMWLQMVSGEAEVIPHAPSNRHKSQAQVYKQHECSKIQVYEQ